MAIFWGVDLPPDLPHVSSQSRNISRNLKSPFHRGIDLPPGQPNMSCWMFRCGHHRDLFALHKINGEQWLKNE